MRHRGHRVQAFRVQLYLLTDAAARRREVRFIVESRGVSSVLLLLPGVVLASPGSFGAPRTGPEIKPFHDYDSCMVNTQVENNGIFHLGFQKESRKQKWREPEMSDNTTAPPSSHHRSSRRSDATLTGGAVRPPSSLSSKAVTTGARPWTVKTGGSHRIRRGSIVIGSACKETREREIEQVERGR